MKRKKKMKMKFGNGKQQKVTNLLRDIVTKPFPCPVVNYFNNSKENNFLILRRA